MTTFATIECSDPSLPSSLSEIKCKEPPFMCATNRNVLQIIFLCSESKSWNRSYLGDFGVWAYVETFGVVVGYGTYQLQLQLQRKEGGGGDLVKKNEEKKEMRHLKREAR